jgi:hypothetical protein
MWGITLIARLSYGALMQDFTKLRVRQKAHQLASDLHREIDLGP